ncbi:LPS export ABC transporter periplasmic protein LptC [Sulfurimonas sp. SWIR-19]|uniref:LPS export ABC transporter periplasmic protein LptC n=1 Tax=Sulfurimonas TaxID=202746 RepID=UPI001CF5656C|nr:MULTISPECIES: LPS export ABC transporter periplasmic protein LptC [Sulfurimonas]UCN01558.1 LPS export ABC transporter periplasmic protein LptC [Sulfurimonas sp. SWIR-19]
MFLTFVITLLLVIFFMFKPMDVKMHHFTDVPLFELSDFTMYELDTHGLTTILLGSTGTRYAQRYEIKDMDYTDNSKKYIANMVSDLGVYKNEIVKLSGHVVYVREDGLTFKSQEALYNKKTADVVSDTKYTAYLNDNVVIGDYIKYNNITKKIYSKNVIATYQLKEEK